MRHRCNDFFAQKLLHNERMGRRVTLGQDADSRQARVNSYSRTLSTFQLLFGLQKQFHDGYSSSFTCTRSPPWTAALAEIRVFSTWTCLHKPPAIYGGFQNVKHHISLKIESQPVPCNMNRSFSRRHCKSCWRTTQSCGVSPVMTKFAERNCHTSYIRYTKQRAEMQEMIC